MSDYAQRQRPDGSRMLRNLCQILQNICNVLALACRNRQSSVSPEVNTDAMKPDFSVTDPIARMQRDCRMAEKSLPSATAHRRTDRHGKHERVVAASPLPCDYCDESLQYQKQLRLQEARRLLLTERCDVASAAHRVGYESPSQFGPPPLGDAERLRGSALALLAG